MLDHTAQYGFDDGDHRRTAVSTKPVVEGSRERPPLAKQWKDMRNVFGIRMLSQLTSISESSLRRYAAGDRLTPPWVAQRLDWVAAVVDNLHGAYNELGVRGWFQRPRPQLDGLTPLQALGANWRPEDPSVRRIATLAASLDGRSGR